MADHRSTSIDPVRRRRRVGVASTAFVAAFVAALAVPATAPAAARVRQVPDPDPSESTTTTIGEPSRTTTTIAIDGRFHPEAEAIAAACRDELVDPGGRLDGDAGLLDAIAALRGAGAAPRIRIDGAPAVRAAVEVDLCASDPSADERVLVVLDPTGGGAVVRVGSRHLATIGTQVWDAGDGERLTDPGTLGTRLRALAAVIVDGVTTDPLGCERLLWDPERQLDDPGAVEEAALALLADGVDLRVRVEGGTDGDIDGRLDQLERSCPGWTVDGDRPDDRLLLVVQPGSRSTGLWYGRSLADRLERRWEAIQDEEMNPEFRDGDITAGMVAGLQAIDRANGRAPYRPFDPEAWSDRYGRDDARSFSSADDDSGMNGLLILLVVVFVVVAVAQAINRSVNGETWDEDGGGRSGGRRRSWSSSSSRRSSSGSSRRSSSRSSSRSSRRSSGGGRSSGRSGGGSTRW